MSAVAVAGPRVGCADPHPISQGTSALQERGSAGWILSGCVWSEFRAPPEGIFRDLYVVPSRCVNVIILFLKLMFGMRIAYNFPQHG